MPRSTLVVMAATAALLAGCVKPLEVASITQIKPTNGAKGLDVHEPRRVTGQQGVPEFAGDQLVEIRTFESVEGNPDKEFAGAACTLSGGEFTATATSPAKVRVPLYRGQSTALAVSCEMAGFRKRSITVAAVDMTRAQRYQTGANGGLIGVVAAVAVDGLSDNTRNDWRYPVARLLMERDVKRSN